MKIRKNYKGPLKSRDHELSEQAGLLRQLLAKSNLRHKISSEEEKTSHEFYNFRTFQYPYNLEEANKPNLGCSRSMI